MLKNFFTIAIRNILRYRTFSSINLIGLTMGIVCALFIFLIVQFERSYDQYHTKANRIYRINKGTPNNAYDEFDMGTPQGLAPVLREEFPELELTANIFKLNPEQTQIEIGDEQTRERELYFADPQFFHMFDFTWLQGTPDTSLDGPNEVVITQSLVKKYFKGDALGKAIRLNNEIDLIVSGIIQDPPVNSDFPVQVVISHATMEQNKEWYDPNSLEGSNSFYHTYVLVNEDTDPSDVDVNLKKMIERHLGKEKAGKFLAFRMMPLHDIHFVGGNFNQRTISRATIRTLSFIGLFVLIIACINFTNLASAQAIRRAKEVGIRKTLGSSRQYLIMQFLGETFVLTLTALIASYIIVSQLALVSKNLTDIPLSPDALSNPRTFLFLGALLLGVTVLSGFYPAFVLSGFKPAQALKNSSAITGVQGLFARKGLIAFQFVISQVLIVSTMIVIKQTNYFNTMPLGFAKDAVLTADVPDPAASRLSTLRNNLMQYPEVKNVSFSLNTPSATINKWWANFQHTSFPGDMGVVEVKLIDSVFFTLFEIEKVAGTLAIPGDSGKFIVVNENLVKAIGISDATKAIGEKINYWGIDATIIGVVRDFQTVTLQEGMHPVLLTATKAMLQKVSVKIDMSQATPAIAHFEKHWKEAFPEYYFTYSFLDDDLASFYKEEQKLSRLLVAFASVAIGIGCIGLLGLIMFATVQRTKEVGIRKVLGATITSIATLLSKDFIILVVLAGIIAWPIAYYAMERWLEGFANKINLLQNSWMFVLAAALAIGFAVLTVGFQSVKAALRNPTESLRSE